MGRSIDLKNCEFKIKDGYAGPSPLTPFRVNFMTGYMAGASTTVVDTGTGLIAVGDTLKFASHDTVYTVTAQTPTGDDTTSITFTPVLTEAVADDEVITIQPHEIEITIGEGNMTYDEKKAYRYVKDRGRLDDVREEDEQEMDVRFDFRWDELKASSGDPPTVEDALKKRGNASAWVSSDSDVCRPYAVDIEVVHTPDECTDSDIETVLIEDFRYESLNHDFRAATVAVTGKSNRTEATVTRTAQA